MVTIIEVKPSIQRLQRLIRHIEDVRNNCEILGTKLIERGDFEDGRMLIASGMKHDASKFDDPEWEHLWDKRDVLFHEAWLHHVHNNDHHPEFWDSIHEMPRRPLGECICDWAARSAEFGTALRPWVDEKATQIYHFSKNDKVYEEITNFMDMLLEPEFVSR